MPAPIDIMGKQFGRWTVIGKGTKFRWLCRCICGVERLVRGDGLRSGASQSCGCLNAEITSAIVTKRNFKHGHAAGSGRSRTYRAWQSMIDRCYNPRSGIYRKYGARGIRVCKQWRQFTNFFADMGECPAAFILDRIKTKGHYEPANCRWATMKEQQNNRTNNRRLVLNGEDLTLMQWAERTGIHYRTIRSRLDRLGWSVERALTTSVL